MGEASESAPHGEKARHGETKASGADARQKKVTRQPLSLYLLHARDRSAIKKGKKHARVCQKFRCATIPVLSAASLQQHRREVEKEGAVQRAARRSPARRSEIARPAVNPWRKRERERKAFRLSRVASAGQP